ncbi:LamG-like jellyroll fold domain-containing protein [Streptomyces sp. H39-S7]|uniref:LamG-like jellyroll fold domain-containing protein n=1 Tax=Streptomyces sp. H39-S7 TaxID=3004357 RepID=UPI0022B0631D|nr:LamG-like jellyroll fold domain-containing protein [Streptomyces sp. H39-S7]MCZ4122652.1 hypothetical protein [Streptomyces sp. H39-S7]
MTTPAHADGSSDPAEAQHAATVPPDEAAADAARTKAASTGQPVIVDSMTTEFEQTVVNPDGTFTTTTSGQPVRAKVAGGWVPVDMGLRSNADGTITPKAAIHPVVLSDGGTGPLATLTNAAGKTLSLSVPFTLPAPILAGDTASYADVLPDVDLQVTVTAQGGLRHVFVVKSAAAAANPALKNLKLGTSGTGLTITANAAGNLQATETGTGQIAFTAPTPTMWDSTPATNPAASPLAGRAAKTATAQETSAAPDPASTSSASGPGPGAQTAVMPTTAGAGSVTITPVQDVLTGASTHYPVYIDPAWLPFDRTNLDWTWIQQGYPTADNWRGNSSTGETHPGVGMQDYQTKTGIERAYYQFNNTAPLLGNVIHAASLNLAEYESSSFSCTTTYPVYVYLSTQISEGTNWNNHQDDTSLGQSRLVGGAGHSGCSATVPFAFDVTSTVQQAANTGWQHITFGLHGNESNTTAFKRLTTNPVLTIQYDRHPLPPTGLKTDPIPRYATNGTTQPCVDVAEPTNQAFVGNPGTGGIHLSANVASEVNQPVRGYFSLWDDTAPGDKLTPHGQGYTGYVPTGNTVTYTVPTADFTDGHAYGWNVINSDGILSSAAVGACRFRVDLSPPTITTPTSADQVGNPSSTFPPSGNGQTTTLHPGDGGWIPFTAADHTPTEGAASGLACMRWSFDPTLSDAAWQCGSALPSGQVGAFPTHWGTNIYYLQAEDNAGNFSQITSYAFYVPWNPHGPAPVFGDTTGDGSADIVTVGADGNLYNHTVPGNTQTTSPATTLAAKAANIPWVNSAPDGVWKDYQLTHRGSLRGGMNVDDLIAHKSNSPDLYLYYNPGNTNADGRLDLHQTLKKPECVDDGSGTYCTGYNNSDWSTTLQIAALGDVSTSNLDPSKHFLNRAGLLTEETNPAGDAALWFYPTVSNVTLGTPVRLSATGWKGWELISPGDWSAQGHPGVWARNTRSGDVNGYTFTTALFQPLDPFGFPTGDPVPTLTTISSGTKIGNLSASTDPVIGSDGDLTGDGVPDLWSVTSTGEIDARPGITAGGPSTPVMAFHARIVVGTNGGTANQWPLAGTGADASGLNAAATTGGVTWTANHKGTTTGSATFDGTAALVTGSSALDTTQNYTVSTWAKIDTLSGDQFLVSQGGTTRQAFDLGYRPDTKTWTFTTTTGDTMTNTAPAANAPAGAATTGVWTHLTGVYDATSHTQTLYINGKYAGATTNTTPWRAPGHLSIGAIQLTSGSALYNPTHGSTSDVRTTPAALTAEQVLSLYQTS